MDPGENPYTATRHECDCEDKYDLACPILVLPALWGCILAWIWEHTGTLDRLWKFAQAALMVSMLSLLVALVMALFLMTIWVIFTIVLPEIFLAVRNLWWLMRGR